MEYIGNRSFLIIKYKKPFVDWVNSIEAGALSKEKASDYKSIYLSKFISITNEKNINKTVEKSYKTIFKFELEDWYTDKNLWLTKKEMTLKLFNEWFYWEFVDSGKDLIRGKIIKSH